MQEKRSRRRKAGRARLALRARNYVETHFASPHGCSTAKIAGRLEVSASLLCHRYRATFGVTIGNDIRKRRVAMAQELLDCEPDRLIKEIAAEVGYMQASYRSFFNAFRAETGMSPSTYQRIAAIRSKMPTAVPPAVIAQAQRRSA